MTDAPQPTYLALTEDDQALVAAAVDTLRARYTPSRHSVAAAVRCAGGAVFTGVNLNGTAFGPCAEPVAIGAALTAGQADIVAIVAVCRREDAYHVLSPCGNCRQLMLDYAPDAMVILSVGGKPAKALARDLLPGPYTG